MIYQRVLDFDPGLDLDDPEVQAALPDATKIPTSALDEMRKNGEIRSQIVAAIQPPGFDFAKATTILPSTRKKRKKSTTPFPPGQEIALF